MDNLTKLLFEQTQSLKVQYLAKTAEWATQYHATCVERSKWDDVDWCKFLGLTPELHKSWRGAPDSEAWLSFPKGFYGTRTSKRYYQTRDEAQRIARLKIEEYLAKTAKIAEEHYRFSIEKLAARIRKKGLLLDVTVSDSSVGVNIETTITDGVKTVRAWTIIASGEVQRPHYRYLIK